MNFPGGEKRKLGGILPEKRAILREKKLKKPLFVENFRGEKSISGGSPPPCPTEKNPGYGKSFSFSCLNKTYATYLFFMLLFLERFFMLLTKPNIFSVFRDILNDY